MPEQNHEGRNALIGKINEQLSWLTSTVQMEVKNNLSTRNVLAETILTGLLNRMEGWKLVNANHIRSNFPAVDLVDRENRVAVQVSSTNSLEKIRHTLEKFQEHHLEADYNSLYVVTITMENPSAAMRAQTIPGIFSGSTDIWNMSSLGDKLMNLDIPVLENIYAYLTLELGRCDQLGRYLYLPAPSNLGDGFVGRERELETIRQQLDEGVKPIVLSGLGGMGKTELAAKFARMHTDGVVYFAHFQGSFENTVRSMFSAVRPQASQPPSESEQFDTVMNLLSRCNEKDLLIIDNVDANSGTLADLMKDPVYEKLRNMKLRLILTTRFDRNRAVYIRPMSDKNLKKIFRTHGADLSDRQMDDLIKAVNGHTMTIDLIARTLNGRGWRRVTANDMLRAIRENTLHSEKYRKIATDYNQSQEQAQIYQHLSVVFDVSGIPEIGRDVLRCATLLPEGGMDGETFGLSLKEAQQDALDELLDHGWLSVEKELLRIHPIVRLVCREELKPTEETCEEFLDALWKQYDKKNYHTDRYSQMADTFAAAADLFNGIRIDWIHHAGFIWIELTQPQKSKNLCDKHLEHLKVQFSDHISLARIYSILGRSYNDLGDYQKALHYKRTALNILKKLFYEDHLELAQSYNDIGYSYGKLGDHRRALDFQKKALEIREKMLPPDHPDLATSYTNIGGTYGNLEEFDKALEFKQKAHEIREKTLPPDHPSLAQSYNNLGYTYCELGNYFQALNFHSKSLKIRSKVLPPNHPHLAQSYHNIGLTYYHLGKYTEGLKYAQAALDIREKVLSPDHPELARSYINAGRIYGKLGEYSKALEYLEIGLAICENKLPALHRYNQVARENIQLYRKKQQLVNNMAKAGFNFENPFASLIPPKK